MSINKSNITAGFIDLATYDELEKYMYGCSTSVSYFVRTTVKSTWFSQIPVILPTAAGQPGFGKSFAVNISRSGDYLLNMWLRVGIPVITAQTTTLPAKRLRWTQNLMHNLIKNVSITFNDLLVEEFDSHNLDMWAAFTVPASKQDGYSHMIGNTVELTDLTGAFLSGVGNDNRSKQLPPAFIAPDVPAGAAPGNCDSNVLSSGQVSETFLNLPLPFFFTRDSGVALPTAALPYNDMTVHFSFRNWNELLIAEIGTVDNGGGVAVLAQNPGNTDYRSIPLLSDLQSGKEPELKTVEVWANYAIVSNDERKRMACAPRDILIEQFQNALSTTYTPEILPNPNIEVRLSHAVKVIFFAVRNTTFANEHSVYTVGSPAMGGLSDNTSKFHTAFAVDPIASVSLVYENTERLSNMGNDYYSYVNPYYTAPSIPRVAGYHCYSYSLDFACLDPMGSTNYGKLTHVSVRPQASDLAIAANSSSPGTLTTLPLTNIGGAPATQAVNGSGVNIKQKYEFILNCVNNNIVRISGGSLGFPVL